MTRILVLNGHPKTDSYCGALAARYADGAIKAGHAVRTRDLGALDFDPDFHVSDFKKAPPLEPDLQAFWDDLVWCEHLVIAHPLWWGGMPAKLKGLFDRVLLPGKAFNYIKGKDLPEQLLKGRSARILLTSDTPSIYLNWLYGFGLKKQANRQILNFCGIRPSRWTQFASMIKSTADQRDGWLRQAEALGARAA